MSFRSTSGYCDFRLLMRLSTASATVTSLAPLERRMLKPTTGSPSARAQVRGSGAEIVEAAGAAHGRREGGGGEAGQRLGAGEGADRLVASADLGASAGEVDDGAAQAAADVERGQPHGLQPVGIEADADLAVD